MIVVTTRARAHAEVPKPYLAIAIDRTTALGNPFKIGRDGTREQVIELYDLRLQAVLAKRIVRHAFWLAFEELVDLARSGDKHIALLCHCAPGACHGDVLKRHIEHIIGSKA